MVKTNKAKTPIFLHYPKCGGTSISEYMRRVFFSNIEDTEKSILCIYDSFQAPLFYVFAESINYANLKNAFTDTQNNWYLPLDDFATLLKWQSKLKIHSIYVTPPGVRYFGNNFLQVLLENYTAIDPFYFMSIRDPWEREKSFFFYLKSNNSEKELTHKYYRDISFEEYVEKEMPDSWLGTTLLEKNSVDLTCTDIDTIIDITKKINFFDVGKLSQSFFSIYKECGFHLEEDIFTRKYNTGVFTQERIDLNYNTQFFSFFKQKKHIEYKLYNILKHSSLDKTT